MDTSLYLSQPFTQNKRPYVCSAVGEVGKCALIAICILGCAKVLQGNALYAAGLTTYGINTALHLLQGKLKQRRVEVISQTVHFAVLLLSWTLIRLYSPKPSMHFSILLSLATITPLFCSTVHYLHLYEAYSLRKAIASKPNFRCSRIDIPNVDAAGATSAFYMTKAPDRINNTHFFSTIGEKVTVATYNTGLISTWISTKLNKMRDPRERARQMAALLIEEHKAGRLPDVLCLQECFEPESMKILVTELIDNDVYPNGLIDVAPFDGDIGLNSGIAFFSRLRIDKVKRGALPSTGDDQWANKSFLILDLVDDHGEKITLVNAHLVSGEKQAEKMAQLAKIKEYLPAGRRVIFTADCNLPYDQVADKIPGMTFYQADKGTFYNTSVQWNHNRSTNPKLKKEQIDHIAYNSGFVKHTPLLYPSFESEGLVPPSDHRIIGVELTLRPADGG